MPATRDWAIFVASSLPPRPTSKIAISIFFRAKYKKAAAVSTSKNVTGLILFSDATFLI